MSDTDSFSLSRATPPPKPVENRNRNERRRSEREQAQSRNTDAVKEIAGALEVLCEPGSWHELRTLKGNGRVTASGYFNDRKLMAKAAIRLNQRGDNAYITLNLVLEELSARSLNHVVDWPKQTTTDEQIVSRRLLLVDIDPERISSSGIRIPGIASTDEEHDAALALAQQIRQWLVEEWNWPAPISMDSGNGAYLLWRVALPNDDAAMRLVAAVLQALADRFNDDKVKIDVSTFNASRIARVPFMVNRKGDDVPSRPHRLARLLDVPSELSTVTREQLQQVASEVAAEDLHAKPAAGASPDLQAALDAMTQRGITVKGPTVYRNGLKYILSECLFNPDHGGTSVAIIEYAGGAKQYSCLHNECKDKRWGNVRRLLGPEASSANQNAQAADYVSSPPREPWPDPEPLGGELPAVPDFDLEMMPKALRPLVEDTSERMQIPPECPAVVAIITLGAASGGRVLIQPKKLDSTWKVFPNIWGGLVAPSGFMKTPTMTAILAPIYEIEAQWQQEHKAAMVEYEYQKPEAELEYKEWQRAYTQALRKKSARPPRPDAMPVAPGCRRLLTNDATKEKLQAILAENPGGLLLYRDELPGWFNQLNTLGHEGDKSFFMEMWNGTPYTVDRITRGTISAKGRVSILGGITPRGLRRYLTDTNEKNQLDDGLLQRFSMLIYPEQRGWNYVDRVPNHKAIAEAKKTYERLLALDPAQPLQYAFDNDAQQLFIAWLTELEAKVRDGTLHPALVSHLSKFRSLMPSLGLVFEAADNGSQTTVSLAHAQQAAEWCGYLESHARRIYSLVISPQRRAAAELGRRLQEGWKRQEGMFALREVYINGWSGLDTADKVRPALEILVDANWIRPVDSGKSTAGRPSEIYAISPRLKELRRCQVSG